MLKIKKLEIPLIYYYSLLPSLAYLWEEIFSQCNNYYELVFRMVSGKHWFDTINNTANTANSGFYFNLQ